VTPPLAVTPAATTSPPRGTLIFTTTGGAGAAGVTWTMKSKPSGGTITNSTTQPGAGVYVAGTIPNQVDVVQAQDAQFNLANATVNVTAGVSIQPASVTLPPSGSQLFTFTGGSGLLGAWSLSTPQYGATIGSSTGLYKAGPGGSVPDVVVVTDSLGNSASRNVTVTGPPVIAPATVSTWPKGTVTLTASAGSGTGFAWDFPPASNLSGGTVLLATPTTATYTAGATGGVTDVVRLTDDLGNVTTRNVTVTAGLSITPASWSLAPKATRALTVTGGSGTGYAWSLPTPGSGTPTFNVSSGASVTYQAGATGSSADVVQVSDSAGNIASANVTITAGLSISPASATVQTGLTQAFTPSGGSGSGYQWTLLTNNSLSPGIGLTTGLYTAGSVPGLDTIRLTDSLGNAKTATITVVAPVTVIPSPASAPPRGGISFVPSGGSGAPYTFSIKNPPLASGGSVTAAGNYTAGATPGVNDVLQVADSAGTTSTINVTVGPGISITPAGNSIVAPRGSISFGATGGKGAPWSWVVSPKPSGGSIDPATGAYQAGPTGGVTDTVTVTDSLGNSATRSVTVTAAATVTPANVTVQYGRTQAFSASAGAGGFTWTLVGAALGSIAPTSGPSTTYTAGTVSGTDTLQATDANNVVVSRTITVVPTLSVATLPASVPPRGARDFTASGGAGAPFTFSAATTPLPSGGIVTGAGHYVAGATPSVIDVLQVTDALGAITSFNVTVTGGVAILPTGTSSTWPKGALTFTPSGGSGAGFGFTPVTMNSGGTIDAAGHYLAGTTGSRTDTVQLTDSLGNLATRDITVGPLPTLSPTSLLVPPGATRTLTGSGGSGSFASWAVSPSSGGTVTGSTATTATYSAGATPGSYQVQATDTAGNVASAAVTVLPPLAIGPGPVSLPPRKAQQFTASGGSSAGSGYQWVLTSKPSGGSVNPATGAYQAGATGGVIDVLQLTDGIGTTTSVSIDVTPGLSISPGSLTLAPGGTWDFIASGGDGVTYAFAYASGGNRSGGSLTSLGGYTAGALEGVTDDIEASDLLGNVATASILVSSAFQVLPAAPVSVPPRGTVDFGFSGGSGAGYAWSILTNGSGGSINPATGLYQAGAKGGSSDVVQVVDSLLHKAQRAVTVTAGLSIAPGGASLAVRGTQQLTASGGSATGWTWTVSANRSGASLSGTGASRSYTAGSVGGVVDEVTVTDSLGNSATIAIQVKKADPLSCGNTSGLPSALGLVGLALLLARRRRRALPAAGALLLLALPALAMAGPKVSARTAVLDLTADQGVEGRVARVATDTLVAELQARAGVPIITERDVRTSMSFEQRKAVACNNRDEDCLADVGGALGVDFIIFGSIAKLDDTYVVSVAAFDERKTVVVRRFQQRSKGISEAGVLDLIEEAARRLAPVLPGSKAPESPGQVPAAAVAVAEPLLLKPAAPPKPRSVEPQGEKLVEALPPGPPPRPPPREGFLVVLRAATPTDGLGLLGGLELGARVSNRWDVTGGALFTGQGRVGATARTTLYLFNVEGGVRPCLGLAGVAFFGSRTDFGLLGSLGVEFRGQRSGFLVELPFLTLLGAPRDTRASWLLAGIGINWRP
jgi:MYXO-CTERM domain-containing protein